MVIGALRAILWAKTCFVAAILNFLILGGNRWSDVVVPAILEISIPKTPLGQSFMLLSGSAQLKQKLLHIRPTSNRFPHFHVMLHLNIHGLMVSILDLYFAPSAKLGCTLTCPVFTGSQPDF